MGITRNVVLSLEAIERIFQVDHDMDYYYNVDLLIRYKVPINLPSSQSSISTEIKDTILQVSLPK